MQLRSSTVTLARPASRRSVRVMAWAGDNSSPFSGLLRIFSPARYLNTKDDFPVNDGFTGDIPRGRRPFKDGYTSKKAAPMAKRATAAATETEQTKGLGLLDYLNSAAERVVGHNFTGDSTEPDWSKLGHRGYKGPRRSHTRK